MPRYIDADKIPFRSYAYGELLVSKDMIDQMPTVETIFGFKVNDLIIFAMACQKCGIEARDLRKFALNTESAFDFVNRYEQELIANAIKYSVAKTAEDINVLYKRRPNDAEIH